jgi:hypothetical protein
MKFGDNQITYVRINLFKEPSRAQRAQIATAQGIALEKVG